MESAIGFSKTKRDYAYQLKVDVYSRNQLLQDRLNDLTWAGYSGNMVAALALSVVSGPVVSVTGATNLMDAGSRYFCESLFWASQPKQAAKT